MKQILAALIILFFLTSCSNSKQQMNLSGSVKGLKKGAILLQKTNDTAIITIDSIAISDDETFAFTTEIKEPEIYYLGLKLQGKPANDFIAFFAEPTEITITTTLKNFEVDAKITGSKNQDKLQEYNKIIERYSNKNLELIQASFLAKKEGNDSLYNALQKQQSKNLLGRYLATVNFAVQNNDYELAPFLMLSQANNVNSRYLDTVYQSLTPTIKNSKYGKALESLLAKKKK